jgi:hypothetical protein
MKITSILSAALMLLFVTQLQAQIVINEYSCANWTNSLNFYSDTEDWVELYNTGTESVDLLGYSLSDDEDNPQKWSFLSSATIPAGGFLRVWCSGRNLKDPSGAYHTSFKLTQTKNNAEHLVLSNPNGVVVEDIEIEKTQVHQSRGRLTDGAAEWRIFTTPSPNISNNDKPNAIGFASRPDMSMPAGFYPGAISVALSTTEQNAVIRYTLNGTEPSLTSALYIEPIPITATTVIKAATFSNNPEVLPSFVQFNTYFVNEIHTLAVVSVASKDVITLANGNQSLRPFGSIEYFDNKGQRKARTYGELNSHGQDSWANDQRSLDWVSRDEMGYNYAIKEKLFPLSDRDEFQRIILRASGDDNYPAAHHPQNAGSAHVRDAYIHNLAKRDNLNLDVRTAEKCIVYLNGQYWGVYDLREIPDDHDYTDYYYGQGKYDIQYVLTWGNTWAEYGGNLALNDWRSIRDFINNNDMNDPLKFQYVKETYDYKSLIDYVIVNSFTVCTDWLNYNTGIWRGLNPDGEHRKWGYILWDNDATFDHYINYTNVPSTQPDALPCNPELLAGGSDPERHIRVLNRLRNNPEVRQYYISRQADLMQTTFGCENMLTYLDSIKEKIAPEMTRHADRWFGTYQEWESNLAQMRTFIQERCSLLPTLLDDCYDVTGPFQATILVDPPGAGSLKINTLDYSPTQLPVTGQYFSGNDVDLLLQATPNTSTLNYQFDHWSAQNHVFSDSSLALNALDLTMNDTIIAHFKTISSSVFEQTNGGQELQVAVSPSPFTEQLNIQVYLTEPSALDFRLLNVTGIEVYRQTFQQNATQQGANSLSLSVKNLNLSPGIYFLECNALGAGKTIKLVK